jgi:hypothetical protein
MIGKASERLIATGEAEEEYEAASGQHAAAAEPAS